MGKQVDTNAMRLGATFVSARQYVLEGEMMTTAADEIDGLRRALSKLGYNVDGREFAALLLGDRPKMH